MKKIFSFLDLDPYFISLPDIKTGAFQKVKFIENASGVSFLCPKCFLDNKGKKHTHRIIIWEEKCPEENIGKRNKWIFDGVDIVTLTLNAHGSRSVLLVGGCAAHFFVTNGTVELLNA